MEIRKNTDIVKLIVRMRSIKKSIISISHPLKGIKVLKTSGENYTRCVNLYQEGACYFFQCCGFLKSQYFGETISPSSKRFLVTKLFLPSYKKFLEFRQNLSLIEVDAVYETSFQILKRNTEEITSSIYTLLRELNKL